MSPVISLWSKYKSKAFIKSNGMRNDGDLWSIELKNKNKTQKKNGKNLFIAILSQTYPRICMLHVSYYTTSSMVVRCLVRWCYHPSIDIYILTVWHVVPRVASHKLWDYTYYFFFGTLDVFYREKIIKINDNETPKAYEQTAFIR